MTAEFTATLRLIATNRCVDVPVAASRVLGSAMRMPVCVSVLDAVFQTTLTPRGRGLHRLFIPASVCRTYGFEPGDDIPVKLDPQPNPEVDALVGELARVTDPEIIAKYLATSPSDRRLILKWLSSTKSEETRARRLQKLIKSLRARP